MQSIPSRRHYGMDWLRIGAFVLLIFYHVGYSFTPWGYQTPTRGVVSWAEIPLVALSPWRLSLLFAISGYASGALLNKDANAKGFLKSRLMRLGLPLLFGLLVVVPPQPYMGVVNTGYSKGYLYFWLHDAFSFRKVMGENLPAIMHMWFVIYLLAYTVALSLLLMVLPKESRARIRQAAQTVLAGPLLLPLGIGLTFAARSLGSGWTDSHHVLHDLAAHVHYGSIFLFGILLRNSEPLREAIAKQWKGALVLALMGYAFVVVEAIYYPGNVRTPLSWREPLDFAKSVQSWGMVIALFGMADRFWNKDGRWRLTLAEAVFPVFIAHQTIMVLASYWLRDKGLTALPEFLAICAIVAAGSWAFYLIGREVPFLRPLIGLKWAKHSKSKAKAKV